VRSLAPSMVKGRWDCGQPKGIDWVVWDGKEPHENSFRKRSSRQPVITVKKMEEKPPPGKKRGKAISNEKVHGASVEKA